ncbi:DNA topoisomerase III [Diaphorobacter sp. DS2]|nr:DNA topoisomerase III [Diaphorobacter sp. DS2]
MKLFICEKPTQANDLAAVLGVRQRGDGCLHNGNGTTVTWAYGHLLEQWKPEQYDEALKSWSLDTLPIAPEQWRYDVKPAAAAQYKVVQGLISKASTVIISTDFDREGEAIARSLLDRAGYSGPIKRLCLTALDEASIKKALGAIREGHETLPLYHAALSRQRADWLVGMNISRLYTVLAQSTGFQETLHIGRVLTPTVALVCQRDREIREFKPSPYWTVTATVHTAHGRFSALWQPPEAVADSAGRCISQDAAQRCAAATQGAAAVIEQATTEPKRESAELPFDLTALQQYANRRWGYTAQQVLDAAQALYEKHKATTYPRTDSRHLPVSQKDDVPDILAALKASDPAIAALVDGADPARKARVFNDAKVTAHHAIIPTPMRANIAAMSEIEARLYDAVRRFYIAQFYPRHEYLDTQIAISCAGHTFTARGKATTDPGWRVVFASAEDIAPQGEDAPPADDSQPPEQSNLPQVQQGERVTIAASTMDTKATRPAPHFTEDSLLAAMANIARFVQDEQFKKILHDTAGLGTSATRAGIIQGAVDRGYFERKKRQIIATAKAHALVAVLPPGIKSPGLTAAWEQELERISTGAASMDSFMEKITGWIRATVAQLKQAAPELTKPEGAMAKAFAHAKPPTAPCFACGTGLIRRVKGKNGYFWGCMDRECNKTFEDARGKPVDPTRKQQILDSAPPCPECGSDMRLRKTKGTKEKRSKTFWGCSDYPNCKGIAPYKAPKKND